MPVYYLRQARTVHEHTIAGKLVARYLPICRCARGMSPFCQQVAARALYCFTHHLHPFWLLLAACRDLAFGNDRRWERGGTYGPPATFAIDYGSGSAI